MSRCQLTPEHNYAKGQLRSGIVRETTRTSSSLAAQPTGDASRLSTLGPSQHLALPLHLLPGGVVAESGRDCGSSSRSPSPAPALAQWGAAGRGDVALLFPKVWGSGGFNFQRRPGWAKSRWVMVLA